MSNPVKIIKPSLELAKTWQALGWMMVGVVVWLSLTPKPPQPPSILGWDKLQHFAAYGSLMYWYGMSFARHWRWPVFLVGLGVGLEFLQGYGGVRSCDPFDMIANTIGVGMGLFIVKTPLGQMVMIMDRLLCKQEETYS